MKKLIVLLIIITTIVQVGSADETSMPIKLDVSVAYRYDVGFSSGEVKSLDKIIDNIPTDPGYSLKIKDGQHYAESPSDRPLYAYYQIIHNTELDIYLKADGPLSYDTETLGFKISAISGNPSMTINRDSKVTDIVGTYNDDYGLLILKYNPPLTTEGKIGKADSIQLNIMTEEFPAEGINGKKYVSKLTVSIVAQ